ncbi:MAG TPA: hypothetical protein EYP55_02385, partial [Anaerolineae bacterium]|nr:hypothetical protein [Anaerolineae bacterium]
MDERVIHMHIAIGADHAGFRLKGEIARLLDELGHSYHDFGAHDDALSDYPDFARPVAQAVARGDFERGILICGNGVGVCIAANPRNLGAKIGITAVLHTWTQQLLYHPRVHCVV